MATLHRRSAHGSHGLGGYYGTSQGMNGETKSGSAWEPPRWSSPYGIAPVLVHILGCELESPARLHALTTLLSLF